MLSNKIKASSTNALSLGHVSMFFQNKGGRGRKGPVSPPRGSAGESEGSDSQIQVMNQCQLSKWIFKLERGDNNPCCALLRAKYLGGGGFYSYLPESCHMQTCHRQGAA